ncbi:MAG: alpha/beta fold hydrolase [Chromatocurvus sp.]
MQARWETFGGSGNPLVFAHANGYPPGSYRQLLQPLSEHYSVSAVRHRPLWGDPHPPLRLRWQLFASDLIDALKAHHDAPIWLLGHSLGAVVGLLAAAREPALFRGLVLLDPVFLPTRFVVGVALTPRSRLRQMPMIRRALARPDQFPDAQAAFDFYRGKRAFANFSDDALSDYVGASTAPANDAGIKLVFPPAWEAGIYGSAPWVWPTLKRVSLPVLGLRGSDSQTLSAAAFRRWGRVQPQAELHTVPGGHLFPLEHPRSTAEQILRYLGRHAG